MKKKVLSILLAATFTVSMLAGCGSSTAKDDMQLRKKMRQTTQRKRTPQVMESLTSQ